MFQTLYIGTKLLKWTLWATAYGVAAMLVLERLDLPHWNAGNEVTAILAVILGMLMVFRTHSTYDRWWEARKLWGDLTNNVRNLALKVRAHVAIDVRERREFARLLALFPDALRLRLRDEDDRTAVRAAGFDPANFPHPTGYVAGLVHSRLNNWNREGKIKDTIWVLDHHARALMDVCGACERIHFTPLVSSFCALTQYGIALYVIASPWAVGFDLGWDGLPAVLVANVFLIGMELTAKAVEDPFGTEGDDLALERYCRAMSEFVHAALDDESIDWGEASPEAVAGTDRSSAARS